MHQATEQGAAAAALSRTMQLTASFSEIVVTSAAPSAKSDELILALQLDECSVQLLFEVLQVCHLRLRFA
jgi:hypothetical protein